MFGALHGKRQEDVMLAAVDRVGEAHGRWAHQPSALPLLDDLGLFADIHGCVESVGLAAV